MAKSIADLSFTDELEQRRFAVWYQNFTPNDDPESSLETLRQMLPRPGPMAGRDFASYLDEVYLGAGGYGLNIVPPQAPSVDMTKLHALLFDPLAFRRMALGQSAGEEE